MSGTAGYIARETLVSAAINAVLSTGFFIAVFGGVDPIPVWGRGNFAFDFIPQSCAVALMAALVPGLLGRAQLAKQNAPHVPAIGAVVRTAIAAGLTGLVAGAGLAALGLLASGAETVPHGPAFAGKIIYGAALGALVTRLVLRRMFDRSSIDG
jgi:hypothetical protein